MRTHQSAEQLGKGFAELGRLVIKKFRRMATSSKWSLTSRERKLTRDKKPHLQHVKRLCLDASRERYSGEEPESLGIEKKTSHDVGKRT